MEPISEPPKKPNPGNLPRYYPEYALNDKGWVKRRVFGDKPVTADMLKCICCQGEIKPVHGNDEQYTRNCPECGTHNLPEDADSVIINSAVVQKTHAGYGSSYDGNIFMLAVCDDCIEKGLKNKSIVLYGRYM